MEITKLFEDRYKKINKDCVDIEEFSIEYDDTTWQKKYIRYFFMNLEMKCIYY